MKSQQRFRSEKHPVFTEKVNKVALRANIDYRKQSIDSIETYAYGTSNDLIYIYIYKTTKWRNIIKKELISFYYITKGDTKWNNSSWPQVRDHLYRILITGGSQSETTNALLNLISCHADTD